MSIHIITQRYIEPRDDIVVEDNYSYLLAYFKDKESIAIDTETEGFDPFNGKLLTIQLGDFQEQWVIDWQNIPDIDISGLRTLVNEKLTLYHNYLFDGKWLYKNGFDPKNIYDSFLCECILTSGFNDDIRKLGLNDVSQKYLNIEISKDDRGLIHKEGLSLRVLNYCITDIKHLHQIREKQLLEIDKWGLQKVLNLENKVSRVFMLMCYHGLKIDKDKWLEVADLTEQTVLDTSNDLDDIIIQEAQTNKDLYKYINNQTNLFDYSEHKTHINWASNTQKKELLNILGIQVEDVANKTLLRLNKHPIVKHLLILAKNHKLSTSFGRDFLNFINPITGRIHPEIWQILSGSARISMQRPNFQQLPSHGELANRIMSAIVTEEGKVLVTSDVGQFELALIAEYSQDPLWLSIFKQGKDLHAELCSRVFKIPIERVKDPFPIKPDLTYRYVSKTISFGLSYGLSEYKLSDILQTTPREAKKIIDQFFSVVPKVKTFLDQLAKYATTKGHIISDPFYKRIRWFPNFDKENFKTVGETERAAKNYVPQSSNGNLLKQCLINLQDIIDNNNYPVRILLTVHDSIVSETTEEFAPTWKDIQETTMKNTITILIKSFPIKIDSTIGKTWRH